MRIVLVPWCLNISDKSANFERIVPLGLLSIAAVLRKEGHDVTLLDSNLPGGMAVPFDHLADAIVSAEPDIVGFSIAAGVLANSISIASKLKSRRPGCRVLFGGPHTLYTDVDILTLSDSVDAVVRGEGEVTICEYTRAIQANCDFSGIAGLTYRDHSGIRRNPQRELIADLDILPMPDYDLYPIKELVKDFVPVEIGRGCPFTCCYCSTSQFWGRCHRTKSIPRIIDEVQHLRDKYGVERFYFRHDQIFKRKSWMVEFCTALKEKDLRIVWQCSARIDTIDQELISVMAKSGCVAIEFGLESGSRNIQGLIGKKNDEKDILNKILTLSRASISPVLFFMTGFPDESRDDVNATLSLILRAAALLPRGGFIQLRALIPFAGTKIVDTNTDRLIRNGEKFDVIFTGDEQENSLFAEANLNSRLFPELYWLKNKHGLSYEEFKHLERFVTRVVQFHVAHFPATFKWILSYMVYNFETLSSAWNGAVGEEWRGSSFLPEDIEGALRKFLVSLAGTEDTVPEWLFDLLAYEETMYRCKNSFSKKPVESSINSDSLVQLVDGAAVSSFRYDTKDILRMLAPGHSLEEMSQVIPKTTTVLFVPLSPTRITTYTIDNSFGLFFDNLREPVIVRNLPSLPIEKGVDVLSQLNTLQEIGALQVLTACNVESKGGC